MKFFKHLYMKQIIEFRNEFLQKGVPIFVDG